MEGDLSEVGYPPRPLPFPIMPKDVDINRACATWLTGKIFQLEEFVCSVVENSLLKQDILFALMAPQSEATAATVTTITETTTTTTTTTTETTDQIAAQQVEENSSVSAFSSLSLDGPPVVGANTAGAAVSVVGATSNSSTAAAPTSSFAAASNSSFSAAAASDASTGVSLAPSSPSISAAAIEAANAFANGSSIASGDLVPSMSLFASGNDCYSASASARDTRTDSTPTNNGNSLVATSYTTSSAHAISSEATAAAPTSSVATPSLFSMSTSDAAAATSSPAFLFPDPTQKLMKLISLQLECSKLQSTLLSMGESIGDSRMPGVGARYGANHNSANRKEPLLAVMCGNGYDRAAQAFLEAATAVEIAIHGEGLRVGKSELLEAWHLDPDFSSPSSSSSSSSSRRDSPPKKHLPGNLLKSLLEHPSQPRSYRPLHLAALHGRRDFGRLLLHHGADVDGRDKKNRTALYWALKSHNEEMALMLLRHGATVTDREYAMALERLYLDVVEAMLNSGRQQDRGSSSSIPNSRSKYRCGANTLLVSKRKGKSLFSLGDIVSSPMKAVVEAKFKPVRPAEDEVKLGDSSEDYLRVALTRMFDEDDDVDIPASSRQRRRSISPLVELDDDLPAAYASKTLVDCANCLVVDADEREALRLKMEILSLLISKGGDVNVKDTKKSPLLAAARKGDERMLEWLRIKGADLHIVFANDYFDNVVGNVARGSTLLHFASHHVISYLISHGVNPGTADSEGRTPFYVKAKAGCVTSMKKLLHANGQCSKGFPFAEDDGALGRSCAGSVGGVGHSSNTSGGPSETTASLNGGLLHSSIDSTLDSACHFDVNAMTKKGKTALLVLLAKMASSPRILDFVVTHPFDPNVFDEDGWSVIFYAAVLGSIDIINVLISKGVRIDVVDQFGNYPFIYALVAHNFSCATILVKGFLSSREGGGGGGGGAAAAAAGESTAFLPSDWMSPFSSIDNISIITRKVKSVFKGIYKNLYEPVDDADSDEEPYLTAPAQPVLHLVLSHGFLHALEDPLNTLFSRPYTSSSRVKAVYRLLEALLRKGYDPNMKSLRNETALGLLLSMRGWRQGLDVPATTLLLLQHGADATVLDGRGRNFLDLTLRSNDLENSTYLFLCGATLKPRHRERVKELVATHDPHTKEERGDAGENESLVAMFSAGCPYGARQRCLSCISDSPLTLKESARIVIRRKLGLVSSLSPLLQTRRKLRLPRELHSYLYLGDIVAPAGVLTLGSGGGKFDWLDELEEEEEEREKSGDEEGKEEEGILGEEVRFESDVGAAGWVNGSAWGQEIDEMEERNNILHN